MKELVAIQLSWKEVAEKIEDMLEKLLGKKISCFASRDDYDFWGIRFYDYKMYAEEIEKICNCVNANQSEREEAFPVLSGTSVRSFGGDMANKMLAVSIGISCQRILATEDALFLIGAEKV